MSYTATWKTEHGVRTDPVVAIDAAHGKIAVFADDHFVKLDFIDALIREVSPPNWRDRIYAAAMARRVQDLELSIRTANVLEKAGVQYVGHLAEMLESDARKLPGMGAKSFKEICEAMRDIGVGFRA